MKSNEYNNVVVKNENSNYVGEFTNAQKYEYSFQSENPTSIKDELNNRKTINDNPEENLLKSTKEKKKERRDSKDNTSTSSEVTSTSASTASSIGGTVAGVAATAATAAAVVIGAVAGISIIEQQKEQDLITFVSSEITTDSIDFVFRMPASLLSYEEDPSAGGDTPRKQIIGYVDNSDGYHASQEFGFEDIDEYTKEGYGYFDGLSAGTTYALTIMLVEYFYSETEEIVEAPTQLAHRTFTTLSWKQKVQFHPLDVTYNSVNFEFEVALADIGVDPLNPEMPNLFAVIFDNDQYRQSLTLTKYSMIDNEHALVYDSFTGLTPETYYTIDIYQDDESNLLGSASFMTYERTSSVVFEDVSSGRSDVSFTFTVDKSDVDYNPTVTPAVRFDVRSVDGTFSDQSWAESFEEVDENTVRSSGSFTGLTPNLEYILEINLSRESEFILLGDTTFDTMSGFRFVLTPDKQVTSNSTRINVAVRANYVGYISAEETPDVINNLYITIENVEPGYNPMRYSFNNINEYGEYVTLPSDTLGGLDPNTTYNLSVYFQPEDEDAELLGSTEFTTNPDPYGFSFHTITPSENSCDFAFDINPDEITSNQIYVKISYNGNELTREQVTQFETSSIDESLKTGSVTISGLPANATLEAQVFNWGSGTAYGTKTFSTTSSSYGFNITDISTTKDSLAVEFYVNPQMFTGNLQEKIYLEYKTPSSGSKTAAPGDFTQTTSDVAQSSFSVSDLTAETEYYGIVYYNGDSLIPLGIFSFTTQALPPQIDGLTSNFEVAQDLNNNFRMPIKIEHHGSTDVYGSSFVLNFMTEGLTNPIQGYVPVGEGEYDYAVFASDSGIDSYLTSGAQFELTVTCANDSSTELYSQSGISFVDVSSASGSNSIYAWQNANPDVYNGDEVTFSFGIVAALFNKSSSLTIIFTSGATTRQFSGISLTDYNYVSNLTINLLRPDGYGINYETCKSTFGNKSFTVQITYSKDGSVSDTITVAEGFMFNFMD